MCWKAMRISMNPGAGLTPTGYEIHQVGLLESYLRPHNCLPVLCVPPSLGPCGLLSQPLSVGLFHSFLCRLAFYSSKKGHLNQDMISQIMDST